MHQLIDDIQEHWPLVLLGLGMVWGTAIWVWGKLVSSPKDLRDCRKDVSIEFGKYDYRNSAAHDKIYDKMEHNHKEVMQTLINHLSNEK